MFIKLSILYWKIKSQIIVLERREWYECKFILCN